MVLVRTSGLVQRTVVLRYRIHLEGRKLAQDGANLERKIDGSGCVGTWCGSMPAKAGIDKLAPHDLRRTCARLCHTAGGELEQIQFLLGHISIQTTERYLGCKQRIRGAVNDKIGIEPPG